MVVGGRLGFVALLCSCTCVLQPPCKVAFFLGEWEKKGLGVQSRERAGTNSSFQKQPHADHHHLAGWVAAQSCSAPFFTLLVTVSSYNKQVSQLTESLKEAKGAEKEVRAEVAGVLREGRSAQQALAAAEAAAEKAVSSCTAWKDRAGYRAGQGAAAAAAECVRVGASVRSQQHTCWNRLDSTAASQPASDPASTHARVFLPQPDVTPGLPTHSPRPSRVCHASASLFLLSLPPSRAFEKVFKPLPALFQPLS